MKDNNMIDCKCSCGQQLEKYDSRGRKRSYIHGHANISILQKHFFPKGVQSSTKPFKPGHIPHNKGKSHLAGSSNGFFGKTHTETNLKKMRGKNNGNWNGGSSRVNDLIRKSKKYLNWKSLVFVRDNRTCVWCGSTKNIEADHIKSFSEYPELRFDINNGRTLCHNCHLKTDNYGMKGKFKKKERILV